MDVLCKVHSKGIHWSPVIETDGHYGQPGTTAHHRVEGNIMTTTTNKAAKAQRVADRALNQFSVLAWRADVTEAASDLMSASQRVLDLMLKARGIVEPDTAREAVQDAFATAYAELQGCTFEEAKSAKSVKNRVADAMAIFKAVTLPASLPKNLQHAATECRKANRVEQAPKLPVAPANDGGEGGEGGDDTGDGAQGEHVALDPTAKALAAMTAALNLLRTGEHTDDVLFMIANLADMFEELSNALAEETEEATALADDVPAPVGDVAAA